MRDFIRGESVEVYAEVRNQAGALVNPTTSIKVTITDAAGDKILLDDPNYDEAMSTTGQGLFYYHYTLLVTAALGWWTALVVVTDGTVVTKTRCGFKVIA